MSTSPTISVAPGLSRRTSSLAHRSAFVNLLLKEVRESRGAVVAGLAIFWIMPAFLEFMYCLVDPHHEFLYGFAWLLLLSTGWLYAVVVGAHTVCRDWGKDQERFLLAQPVSPRSVVGAKLIAGALTVALVVVVATVWDWLVWRFVAWDPHHGEYIRQIAVILIGPLGMAYLLAFAGAVVTRQTLTSVLLACLVLLMWAVAPLLSAPLAALHPGWETWGTTRESIGPVFAAVVVLGAIGCIVLALIASARERVIQLGHKALAWTVAVVVLALFGMAYMEVGNALAVVDEGVIPLSKPHGSVGWIQVAARDDSIYAILAPRFHSEHLTPYTVSVAGFRVDHNGKIVNLRCDVAPIPARLRDQIAGESRFAILERVAVDDTGHLLAMGMVRTKMKDENGKTRFRMRRFWQAKYAWPEGESPKLLSLLELPIAPRSPLPHNAPLMSWAFSSRHVYLTYGRGVSGPARTALRRSGQHVMTGGELVVLDWSDGLNAEPRFRIKLPVMVRRMQASGGKVMLFDDDGMNLVTFDADHPESLAGLKPKLKKWGVTLVERVAIAQYTSAFGMLDTNVAVTTNDDLTYVRHRFGLKVFRWDPSPEVEDFVPVGEYRSSRLTNTGLWQTQHHYPGPRVVNDTFYAELGSFLGPVVTLFDVSDPAHPTRVGFFHDHRLITGGRFSPIEHVIPTDRHLVMVSPVVYWHKEGKPAELRVSVVEKPQAARRP